MNMKTALMVSVFAVSLVLIQGCASTQFSRNPAQAQADTWKHIRLGSTDNTQISIDYPPAQTNGSAAWYFPVWFNVTLPQGKCNVTGVNAQLVTVFPYGGYGSEVPSPLLNLAVDPSNTCHYSAPMRVDYQSHSGVDSFKLAIDVLSLSTTAKDASGKPLTVDTWLVDPAHKDDPSSTNQHNFHFSLGFY